MSRRPFLTLVLAETLSLSGTRLSMIALPWLVLTTTGDAVLTGAAAMVEMLPYVLVKALGGPLIDRVGASRVAVAGDLAATLVIALVPLLHLAGLLSPLALLPLIALLGALRGPADAAKQALVPVVASASGLRLERVTGTLGTIERLASTVGAAAAGGLVALLGPALALAATAVAFALSALVVLLGLKPVRRPTAGPGDAGYLRHLAEGWQHFRTDPVLVGIVLMVAATNFLDQANAAVLLPVWASGSGGVALLGLLFATFSGASAAGSLIATVLAERLPRLPVYIVAFLVAGAPRFVVFALGAPLPVLFAVLAIGGFAAGFLNPILSAVIFERIPAPLVGRVNSLVNALCWGLMPFGGIAAGLAIATIGLPAAFAVTGVAYLAATMLPLALRGFRDFAGPAPAAMQRPAG